MNRREILALGAAGFPLSKIATAAVKGTKTIFDVRDYGAVGDGKAKNTVAIQSAIDAAFHRGGGIVCLGPGDYLSGGVVLKSNVSLYLDAGSTFRGSTDLADYTPQQGPDPNSDANVHHLIFARNAVNVTLCGPGQIDGQGRAFWVRSSRPQVLENFWKESVSNTFRPVDHNARPSPMLEFVNCKNLRIEDITLANSAGWTMRPVGCESVFINGLKVRNPVYGPNTDGLDVTCCRNVSIANCDISTGDDAICLKSENPYGGEIAPTKNITISNCVLTGCCNGFKMGTATKGAFENITFANSVIYNEDVPLNRRIIAGIAVEMVDGGTVHGVVICNVRMQNTRTPIFIRLGNRSGGPDAGPRRGALRGIMIDNVYATGATLTSSVTGLPGHDVEDINLSNILIETREGGKTKWVTREVPDLPKVYPEAHMFGRLPAYGFYCRHVRGVKFDSVRVEARKSDVRPVLVCDDVKDLDIGGLAASTPVGNGPLLLFRDVRRAFVHGCCAPPRSKVFLCAEGRASSSITLIGNDVNGARHVIRTRDGASRDAISCDK